MLIPLLVLVASSASAGHVAVGAGENWTDPNGGADESAYSRLHQISSSNIRELRLAWWLDLPGEASLEATPLAVDGRLYFTGTYAAVYAVDAKTGKLSWKFDPKTWKYDPVKMTYNFAVNRGAAYAHGRIFSAALDGRLFALDAGTGKLIWSVQTTGRKSLSFITGAPRVFDGMVIIGSGGGDFGIRCAVTAYDQRTGKEVWRFYTTPGSPGESKGHPAMERAAKTWSGDYWKGKTGGAVWDGITFDTELDRIYIGTGNPAPYDPQTRSPGNGDNLYTSSIVALDARTGRYIWHYQINPRDAWDYDSTQQISLATLEIGGRTRKVLMQAPKSGFFYVIDRETGKLLSAGKAGKETWAKRIDLETGRPVEEPHIYYHKSGQATIWPAPIGVHNWQSMSYDPGTGLVYIPAMQIGAYFTTGEPEPGDISIGGLSIGWAKDDPHDGKGSLLAWDPVHQREAWRVWHDTIWNGGVLSTAGNVVFQGTADGYFSAYDATTGRRLWRFNAGLGIIAAPMSYAVDGKQYVSVLVGYGGSASVAGPLMNVGWKYGVQPRRLLTFAIGGQAVLPPSAPADLTVHAVDNPGIRIKPADVAAGRALFLQCALCHGRDLVSAGAPAPDLRESRIALYPDSLWSVVHDGTLLSQGMPRFAALSRTQVNQIYAYIRAGARMVLRSAASPPKGQDAIRPLADVTGHPNK